MNGWALASRGTPQATAQASRQCCNDRDGDEADDADGTVGWELPWKQITLDKPSEFGRDRFAFVARICSEILACNTPALSKEPARIIRKQGCAAGRHDGSRLSVPKRLHAPCLAWQMYAFAQTRN